VKDNGIGFPEDIDFQKTDSLGLQLVNSLTSQIDGEILNLIEIMELNLKLSSLK
jgi:two-component sensor histidine kinase